MEPCSTRERLPLNLRGTPLTLASRLITCWSPVATWAYVRGDVSVALVVLVGCCIVEEASEEDEDEDDREQIDR